MALIALLTSLLATCVSIIFLTRIAVQNHNKNKPQTLSELVTAETKLLHYFRIILLFCGTLFAIAVYGFLAPNMKYSLLLAIAWSLTYFGNLALAAIPARDKTMRLHIIFAQIMAFGMLGMAYIFWLSLSNEWKIAEACIAITMSMLAILTIVDAKRFIFYELPFLYLSHFSIVIAVLALA